MSEAESLDVNAGIHGNYTIENSKSQLNQSVGGRGVKIFKCFYFLNIFYRFMQANKIQGEFRYTPVGAEHNR